MYEINVIKCKLDLNTKQILQYNDCATTKNWNMYNSFGSPLSCIIIPEGNSVQANIFLFYITHVCIWKLSSLAEHDQICDKQTQSAPQNDHPPKLTMISYLLAINSDKQKSGFTPLMNPKFQGAPPAPPLSTALQIP